MENSLRVFKFDLKKYVEGVWDKNIPIVRHVVIEGVGIDSNNLEFNNLTCTLNKIINKLNLHIVNLFTHKFEPQGVSQVFILEESHFAVHSWLELGYIHIDIVTCSKEDYKQLDLAEMFHSEFKPISTRTIKFIY